jgi:histone H3/H4
LIFDNRFSDCVIDLMHLASETYLYVLCKSANLCALHAGRETLYPKDIQLVRKIMKDDIFN